MSFFKKFKRRKDPDAKAGAGLPKNKDDIQDTPLAPSTAEEFSTVGDYGLHILSDNTDDIVE
jgi:hypothetical protein